MPDIQPCPTCKGNAYSTPYMDGTRWHAVSGRGEVARLQAENERLRSAINNMVKASEVGSASDAIQDMLEIARAVLPSGTGEPK